MGDIEDINKNAPHFNVMAICLTRNKQLKSQGSFHQWVDVGLCLNKWIATVPNNARLFELECPKCEGQNSFVSFLPGDFMEWE